MNRPTTSPPGPGDLFARLAALSSENTAFVVMLLLRTEGSTPCRAGARAVWTSDGRSFGTVGGGPLEAEAQRRASQALQTGQPEVFDCELLGEALAGTDPICGGRARILIDPTAAGHASAYAAADAARGRPAPGILITRITQAHPPQVTVRFTPRDQPLALPVPLDAETMHRALDHEEPVLIEHPARDDAPSDLFLIEPILPRPRLVIVGGGHVGQAVAHQADQVGFELLVIDDRPEYTRPELFPRGATLCCGDIATELGRTGIDSQTFVVIVTRGHRHDAAALECCLPRPAAYLGMIGSRRKVSLMRQAFIESGHATAESLDRVHAPIGLAIGAVTLPEIAVSVVAELIAVRRGAAAPQRKPPP